MNLKQRIREAGVYQWEIAEQIGVNEVTFCRWLRRPEKLKPSVRQQIEMSLKKISAEKKAREEGE